jgi:hypothetical protein
MSDSWYELAPHDAPLLQGDIIERCPLIGWKDGPFDLRGDDEAEVLKGVCAAVQADVIVMTQACDLAQDKVRNVILCPHLSLTDFRKDWEANA